MHAVTWQVHCVDRLDRIELSSTVAGRLFLFLFFIFRRLGYCRMASVTILHGAIYEKVKLFHSKIRAVLELLER
jgi:hypothetical protein